MARFSVQSDTDGPSNPKRHKTCKEDVEEDPSQQQQEEQGEEEEEEEVKGEEQEEEEEEPVRYRVSNDEQDVMVVLTDPEVFDCLICFEPLCSPVFQCENGHIACSQCCTKLQNKCPMCTFPIGYNRCRAIENVLDSIKISCHNRGYGCNDTLKYCEKRAHEIACNYAPCSCPMPDCCFYSAIKDLWKHLYYLHVGSGKEFAYASPFIVTMSSNQQCFALLEMNQNDVFILKNCKEPLGNLLTISRICSDLSKRMRYYKITVKDKHRSLRFQSLTENKLGKNDDPPKNGFLLVPSDFIESGNVLHLTVQISCHHL